MKSINKFLIGAGIVASMGLTSCVGDLDLLPTDPNQTTAGMFKENPELYMNSVMADVYLNFSTMGQGGNTPVQGFDGGYGIFQRALFNLEEITSDNTNWCSTSDTDLIVAQYNALTSTSGLIYNVYSRLYINIALCNDFIATVNDGLFGLNDSQKELAREYVRQAKTLRSACYFYMLSLYGNVPYADENTGIGTIPAQRDRKDVFELVVRDLETVVAEWPQQVTGVYGYVNRDVAEALLVKMYQNAEVFTGTPQWGKCLEWAEKVIARHKGAGFNGSGLAPKYRMCFGANSADYAWGGSSAVNEIIWGIPADTKNLTSWGNTTLMVDAFIMSDGLTGNVPVPVPGTATYDDDMRNYTQFLEDHQGKEIIEKNGRVFCFDKDDTTHGYTQNFLNAGDAWVCCVVRPQLAQAFEWDDANMGTSRDERVEWWGTSALGYSFDDLVYTQDGIRSGKAGYIGCKFTNWYFDEDGTLNREKSPIPEGAAVGGMCPMLRLSEVYLSAAEAILHGAGSASDALTYVNYIRERAGLDAWTPSDLTLTTLQDERQRELYYECTRRTDLIRYGKWTSGYNWAWKNGTPNGSDLPDYATLYPLPSKVLSLTGYKQNNGY